MSNQGTDCFLELLLLAASALEQTPAQRGLTAFLENQREVNRIAPGTADFDVEEMPWEKASIREDALFLLRVAEAAKRRSGWEKLGYMPEEQIAFPWLDRFAEMVREFSGAL
jgi:hypothetical protein